MTVVPAKAYKAFWHRARRTKLMRSCTVWSALGCVLIFMTSNESWRMDEAQASLWSVAYDNIPVFYSKWWVVEKLFPYEYLRFYLWRSPTIPGVETPGTAFIGPHVSCMCDLALMIRTWPGTKPMRAKGLKKADESDVILYNKYISNKYYTVLST